MEKRSGLVTAALVFPLILEFGVLLFFAGLLVYLLITAPLAVAIATLAGSVISAYLGWRLVVRLGLKRNQRGQND
jgi:membrane protein implicated in regulation of membrane protease activity